MPVDARIPLGVEPVKMPDFAQLAVQRAAVQNSMVEMAAKQRALNEQNTLAQLMQAPDFDFNNPEKRNLVMRYAPNIGPEVIKNHDLAAEAQTKAQAAARAEKEAQRIAALMELFQHDTFEGAETSVDAMVAQGALTQAQADAVKARMRASPDYATFAFNHARSLLKPEQMTEVIRTTQDLGDRKIVTATPKFAPVGTAPVTEATYGVGISPDQAAANARAAANERQQSTRPIVATNADGSVTLLDPNILSDRTVNPEGKSSITIAGIGKPSGGVEKAQAARGEFMKNYAAAKAVADALLTPNSDLERAGGGGMTTAANFIAGLFDQATPSAEAQGALDVAADTLLKQIQRFEGPQSDKDVESYEKAAASLRNTMAPAAVKKAALKVLRDGLERQKKYYDDNPQAGASATGSGAPPSGIPKDIQDILNQYPKR